MNPLAWTAAGLVGGWLYFHRQPDRHVPADPFSVVSPAAGRVLHIERTSGPQVAFFKNDVLNVLTPLGISPPFQVVVIELSVFDVHVQRAPIAGRITGQQYYPGQHLNALYSADVVHLANANEKLLTVLSGPAGTVGVVQVAGLVARRIEPYTKPGDVLQKGARLGMITFGSQVVLILPAAAQLLVTPGQALTDGETVVARMPVPLGLPTATSFQRLHSFD